MLGLYTHNIVLWKRKLKKAADTAKFVDIFCSEKGKYKFKNSYRWYCLKCHKYIKDNKKKKLKTKLWLFKYFEYLTHSKKMSEYGCHRLTFWRNTKIFKNKNILFLNQEIDILLSILMV